MELNELVLIELKAEVAMLKALVAKAMDIAIAAQVQAQKNQASFLPLQPFGVAQSTIQPILQAPVTSASLASFMEELSPKANNAPDSEPVPQAKMRLSPFNVSGFNHKTSAPAFDDMLLEDGEG